jgi:Carboxypeptidase regulatory-like domain/TonB-dependent Receptor Plug Domain
LALEKNFMLKGFRSFVAFVFLTFIVSFGFGARPLRAQASGAIEGIVKDSSGGAIAGATVEISNPVSKYERTAVTDSEGKFRFANVPFNPYHVTVKAAGFADFSQDAEVRSLVATSLNVAMNVAGANTTVTVEGEGNDLVETESTFHTDVDKNLIDRLPVESSSSSFTAITTMVSPGVAADSNGLMHGLGDHASNSISLDGQPITDQFSKVFSNQLPSDAIQSMEIISGAPPAEYGDKTSLVIKATTRSGLGVSKPTGSVTASYGSFGTSTAGFDVAFGGSKWGNFVAVNGLQSGRFLDPPEFTVMHAKGNQESFFDRVDLQTSDKDTLHLNLSYTRSWFQTPNSFDAQNATAWNGLVVDNNGLGPDGLPVGPQDQRSKIGSFNIAPSWTRVVSANTVLTAGAFVRQDQYNYYPSKNPFADFTPDLQSESVAQSRRLTNAGVKADLSYVKGIHNIKVGVVYDQTFLTENDHFGIVDPTFLGSLTDNNGDPCVDSSGTPIAAPCTTLAPFDLTRGGRYDFFRGHTDVKELALFAQDTISWKNWSFNLGIRGDIYNGVTHATQAEPRLGIAYNIKPSNTVLRVSYARTLETPFNENLVLASTGCNDVVVNALMSSLQGSPCITDPLAPGWRNEFHAGLQQAFGKHLVVDAEYIWKYTHGAYDFSVLGSTPITFPIEWQRSKIPGYAIRASVPDFHGFTALVVMSGVAARFFQPQLSGIGTTPAGQGGDGVFRIDHDEKFNQTTHLQYQPWKRGPWVGFNWRYDSGLVAGAAPFGDGVNPIDVSGLTPDQQFQAGLFCGSVRATPTTPISPTGFCDASLFGSTLINIPSAGTENDDKKPPRISPRHLFDLAVGHDDLFHGDRYRWSLRLTAINLTNETALYNFLSTFSGTHYVTPRSYTAELGFHF